MANRPTGRRPKARTPRISKKVTAGSGRISKKKVAGRRPRPIDFIGNIFEARRPGNPIIRPEDLLALRVELRNLSVKPGTPPTLKKAGTGNAFLILHFPPQSITEETFFEESPEGMEKADKDPTLPQKPELDPVGKPSDAVPPPFGRTIRARIADESRLVFKVPNDAVIPYTLEGILTAVQGLEPKVAATARPRQVRLGTFASKELLAQAGKLKAMKPVQRARLSSFITNSLRIARSDAGAATLLRRQLSTGSGLKEVAKLPADFRNPALVQRPPKPAAPDASTTAIEIPWRLIISPHKNSRWRHATSPVTSTATEHTELWHSRLVVPDSKGMAIEPPHADRARTVRAIWAKTGEGSTSTMTPDAPDSSSLQPNLEPFRMPMDDFDRIQIAHLSSNFAIPDYQPAPVDANLLMMSALGGWLDSRGSWLPPGGFSVEEWVHRASMARDHYVKVVYKGFLFPFGHQVSLVKVSERKFHNGARNDDGQQQIEQVAGNPAYLRQRMFIVVRERERTYDAANLKSKNKKINLALQLPFSKIRILTEVTPNLDDPQKSQIKGNLQKCFWPQVNDEPFRFQCVAIDLDGRRVAFELPMIFMDNTFAAPFKTLQQTNERLPDYQQAALNAITAMQEFSSNGTRKTAQMNLQRIALAASLKSGDTSVQVSTMDFGGFAEEGNPDLVNASGDLSRPLFFPKVEGLDARIGALAHLTGSGKSNRLEWHPHYLEHGFDQKGEVFVNVVKTADMARLDFSAQGDRSGGFVQPNLEPQALSRIAGPIMGDVTSFIDGTVPQGAGFPISPGDLPLPLIFGCIPLGSIIDLVGDLTETPERIPKFGTEAGTKIESFINDLVRLIGFVTEIASQPANIARAALDAYLSTLGDHVKQTASLAAAQRAQVQAAINDVENALQNVAGKITPLLNVSLQSGQPAPTINDLPGAIANARAAIAALVTAANAQVSGVSLPAGFRQSLLNIAQKADDFLADLQKLPTLVTQGKALFDALDAVVGQPGGLGDLLSNPSELKTRVEAIGDAIGDLKGTVGSINLMAGAAGMAIVNAMTAVEQAIAIADDLLKLLEQLTGDELTIRFDWNPEISSFPASAPIFRVNDKRGFSIAVEAKVKKHGDTTPKISVVCGLKHFDLVLIAPASFIELQFEKIEFSIDSAAKMDVDVLFTDIKFVGPLSFVEVLRDLIPLDGFSDPPYLDISPQGIDAGFSVALPSIAVGVLNLSNLSLGAGFTVPFIGQPLSVRFNFCTREQPFLLTVYMFGGGGFFGITIDPNGVQILEASFEFGAAISIDLGVASGGVSVMAGIYFRMEQTAASLTGYFRLAGHVDVLGLITASLELYLELRYEFESGKCVGRAQLTIEISLFIFSGSVTISCERKFAGSNGDPNLRQMLGLNPGVPLQQELNEINSADIEYAWREHCEAFA